MEMFKRTLAESQKHKEELKRRKIRIEQIRKQAAKWTREAQQKFQQAKEEEIKKLIDDLTEEAEQNMLIQIQEMADYHDEGMDHIGEAHILAACMPTQEEYDKAMEEKMRENRRRAKERFRIAMAAERGQVVKKREMATRLHSIRSQLFIDASVRAKLLPRPSMTLRPKSVQESTSRPKTSAHRLHSETSLKILDTATSQRRRSQSRAGQRPSHSTRPATTTGKAADESPPKPMMRITAVPGGEPIITMAPNVRGTSLQRISPKPSSSPAQETSKPPQKLTSVVPKRGRSRPEINPRDSEKVRPSHKTRGSAAITTKVTEHKPKTSTSTRKSSATKEKAYVHKHKHRHTGEDVDASAHQLLLMNLLGEGETEEEGQPRPPQGRSKPRTSLKTRKSKQASSVLYSDYQGGAGGYAAHDTLHSIDRHQTQPHSHAADNDETGLAPVAVIPQGQEGTDRREHGRESLERPSKGAPTHDGGMQEQEFQHNHGVASSELGKILDRAAPQASDTELASSRGGFHDLYLSGSEGEPENESAYRNKSESEDEALHDLHGMSTDDEDVQLLSIEQETSKTADTLRKARLTEEGKEKRKSSDNTKHKIERQANVKPESMPAETVQRSSYSTRPATTGKGADESSKAMKRITAVPGSEPITTMAPNVRGTSLQRISTKPPSSTAQMSSKPPQKLTSLKPKHGRSLPGQTPDIKSKDSEKVRPSRNPRGSAATTTKITEHKLKITKSVHKHKQLEQWSKGAPTNARELREPLPGKAGAGANQKQDFQHVHGVASSELGKILDRAAPPGIDTELGSDRGGFHDLDLSGSEGESENERAYPNMSESEDGRLHDLHGMSTDDEDVQLLSIEQGTSKTADTHRKARLTEESKEKRVSSGVRDNGRHNLERQANVNAESEPAEISQPQQTSLGEHRDESKRRPLIVNSTEDEDHEPENQEQNAQLISISTVSNLGRGKVRPSDSLRGSAARNAPIADQSSNPMKRITAVPGSEPIITMAPNTRGTSLQRSSPKPPSSTAQKSSKPPQKLTSLKPKSGRSLPGKTPEINPKESEKVRPSRNPRGSAAITTKVTEHKPKTSKSPQKHKPKTGKSRGSRPGQAPKVNPKASTRESAKSMLELFAEFTEPTPPPEIIVTPPSSANTSALYSDYQGEAGGYSTDDTLHSIDLDQSQSQPQSHSADDNETGVAPATAKRKGQEGTDKHGPGREKLQKSSKVAPPHERGHVPGEAGAGGMQEQEFQHVHGVASSEWGKIFNRAEAHAMDTELASSRGGFHDLGLSGPESEEADRNMSESEDERLHDLHGISTDGEDVEGTDRHEPGREKFQRPSKGAPTRETESLPGKAGAGGMQEQEFQRIHGVATSELGKIFDRAAAHAMDTELTSSQRSFHDLGLSGSEDADRNMSESEDETLHDLHGMSTDDEDIQLLSIEQETSKAADTHRKARLTEEGKEKRKSSDLRDNTRHKLERQANVRAESVPAEISQNLSQTRQPQQTSHGEHRDERTRWLPTESSTEDEDHETESHEHDVQLISISTVSNLGSEKVRPSYSPRGSASSAARNTPDDRPKTSTPKSSPTKEKTHVHKHKHRHISEDVDASVPLQPPVESETEEESQPPPPQGRQKALMSLTTRQSKQAIRGYMGQLLKMGPEARAALQTPSSSYSSSSDRETQAEHSITESSDQTSGTRTGGDTTGSTQVIITVHKQGNAGETTGSSQSSGRVPFPNVVPTHSLTHTLAAVAEHQSEFIRQRESLQARAPEPRSSGTQNQHPIQNRTTGTAKRSKEKKLVEPKPSHKK